MSIGVISISDLDPALVDQLFAQTTEMMQEQFPEVELMRGPFHDLVLYFSSVFGAVTQTNINLVLQSNSLLAISNNPTLADPTIVDGVLSNFKITRQPGAAAAGEIAIIVNDNATTVISANLVFTANGQTFTANGAFTGRPAGSILLTSNDSILQPLGDGSYQFAISATATATGPAGNITQGTLMVPNSLPANFVTAFAATDFSNGFDEETNQQLLDRMQAGVAATSEGGAINVIAQIKGQTEFARTLDYSVLGYGDPEQQRDQHWIMPMSGGGRVDIYARTQALPLSSNFLLIATLVGTTANNNGIWQLALTRDLSPGFYKVETIQLPSSSPNATNYEISLDLRGYDLSGPGFVPDIQHVLESAYTPYQTAVIRFVDTDTPLLGLTVGSATQQYQVTLSGMPLLADMQSFVGSGEQSRPKAHDVLVRGPVPCYLSLSFQVRTPATTPAPDTAAIANALANKVNSLGFCGRLYGSTLDNVIHSFLQGQQAVGPLDMFGKIRRPDGSWGYIRDKSVLIIPDDPSRLVTGRTTAFMLDPKDVAISVVATAFTNR